MDRLALRARLIREGRPIGRVAARPNRIRSLEEGSMGRQASRAGTGAVPNIESPRVPQGPASMPDTCIPMTEEASP